MVIPAGRKRTNPRTKACQQGVPLHKDYKIPAVFLNPKFSVATHCMDEISPKHISGLCSYAFYQPSSCKINWFCIPCDFESHNVDKAKAGITGTLISLLLAGDCSVPSVRRLRQQILWCDSSSSVKQSKWSSEPQILNINPSQVLLKTVSVLIQRTECPLVV